MGDFNYLYIFPVIVFFLNMHMKKVTYHQQKCVLPNKAKRIL